MIIKIDGCQESEKQFSSIERHIICQPFFRTVSMFRRSWPIQIKWHVFCNFFHTLLFFLIIIFLLITWKFHTVQTNHTYFSFHWGTLFYPYNPLPKNTKEQEIHQVTICVLIIYSRVHGHSSSSQSLEDIGVLPHTLARSH